MLRSKALKDFPEKKDSKLYAWWLESGLRGKWHDFTWKYFRNPVFQIRRLYSWYKEVFRFDCDFDSHGLFAIIEYKLKRVERVLLVGHAIQEDKDMKALRLAIKIAGRLKADDYEDPFRNRHDRKWGESKNWFEPCNDGSDNSYWRSSRPKAVTKKQKAQEKKEYLAFLYASEAKREREEKWLYGILKKYLRVWWD